MPIENRTVEIALERGDSSFTASTIRLLHGAGNGRIDLGGLGAQGRDAAAPVARALAAIALHGQISSDTHTFDLDLAERLHHFVTEVKHQRVAWSDPLFKHNTDVSVKSEGWRAILKIGSRQRRYATELQPGWQVVVTHQGKPLESPHVRRFITGGSLEHLARGLSDVRAQTDVIIKSQQSKSKHSAFWPWLGGAVLREAAQALERENPHHTDIALYEQRISQGLKACRAIGWVLALCGWKPFPNVAAYYQQFFRFAKPWSPRIRVCRAFVEPEKGFSDATLRSIAEHNAAPGVQALVVPRDNRDRLENEYFGIAESLDTGFGFVLFHGPNKTWAITHEGTTVADFRHIRLWPPFNLRPLVHLFSGLSNHSAQWGDKRVQKAVTSLLDPIKTALWID